VNVELLKSVAGGSELLDWFDGHAPRFHDAEVLGIAFDREGPTCTLRVHAFKMTGATNADGYYVLEGHVVVTFRIEEVIAMQLDDFNHQNALMALNIARAAEGGLRLDLEPAFGLSGHIEGRSLSISLEPGIPPKRQYAARANVS